MDQKPEKAFAAVLYYFLIWGLYSALWFDFHNIVVGACLLPWLFYYNHKQKVMPFLLMFLALLLVKETVSLWLAFIMMGLLLVNISERKFYQRIEFYLMLVSFGYFFMVVSVVMPALAQSESNWQLGRYQYLGGNLGEILKTLVSNPFHSFLLLFGKGGADGVFTMEIVKIKFWMVFILAGGFLFIYKPKLLIMLVPILGQKMLADDAAFWGPHNQYSIEFVPIFSYLFLLISTDKLGSTKQWFVIALSFMTTIFVISDKYIHWLEDKSISSSVSEYQVDISGTKNVHWNAGSIFDIYSGLGNIPEGTAVSATSTLVPHIANREAIYMFPVIMDAEFIALHNTHNTYPLTKFEYQQKVTQVFNDNTHELIYNKGNLIILRKRINSEFF